MEKKTKTTTQIYAPNFKNIKEQMVEYSKQHPGQQCFYTDSLTVYLLVSLQLAASIVSGNDLKNPSSDTVIVN